MESNDSRQDDVFHWTHCTRSWPSTRSRAMRWEPMNLQEDVKKLEEQESAVNVACPMEDEASWVITCKGDHEEEVRL